MAVRRLGHRVQRHRHVWPRATLLSVSVLVITLPLIWTVLASFGVKPYNTAQPPTWTWPPSMDNYAEVVVAVSGFPQEFTNSVVVSTMATLLAVGVAFLAAYSLARLRFRGKRLLVQSFLVLATLPAIAYVIPLSDIARHLRLHDTLVGLALADAAFYTPLAVYVLHGYVARVDPEMEEAARLEGASILQVLWHVITPAAAPGLAATAVLVFALNWNLLLIPLVLTLHIKTIPVGVIDFFTFERELEWSAAAAALIVSLLPALTLMALAHRTLERFSLGATRQLS